MRIYCTITDLNYLKRVLALHYSMDKWCGPHRLYVLGLGGKCREILGRLKLPNLKVVAVKEVETPAWWAMRSVLGHSEWIWGLKANWMLKVLESEEHVTYVDGDCCFFGSDSELVDAIGSAHLALTPHRFSLKYAHYIKNGVFNAGLIYADCTQRSCLKAWDDLCLHSRRGHLTGQIHLDDWPKRWGAKSINHEGINLAPWNQRQYGYGEMGAVRTVNLKPIVLYHFHGGLTTVYPIVDFLRRTLYVEYGKMLRQMEIRMEEVQ